MKITHNELNDWRDEARYLNIDADLLPWITAIEKVAFEAGKKYAIEFISKSEGWEESEMWYKEKLLSPEEFKKELNQKKE